MTYYDIQAKFVKKIFNILQHFDISTFRHFDYAQ